MLPVGSWRNSAGRRCCLGHSKARAEGDTGSSGFQSPRRAVSAELAAEAAAGDAGLGRAALASPARAAPPPNNAVFRTSLRLIAV